MEHLIDVCYERLAEFPHVTVAKDESGTSFSVYLGPSEDEYNVSIECADVEDDERGLGGTLSEKHFLPADFKVGDHAAILDVCLDALARSDDRAKISDLTTDGDNHDCEAIFYHENEGDLILKVR